MKCRLIAAAVCALLGLGGPVAAQDYPARPVKMIIAFSPAGAIDILGRLIADRLSQMWGQQVVVENRPGGSGNIGAAAAAAAQPDGYTLHFGAQTLATNVTLSPATAFDPVTSFDPIILVASSQEVFQVSAVTPYQSIQEVVDYAKANPGKLNYYSVGIGSTSHLSTVLFMDVTGTRMQHVPYSQMSQGMNDLMSGRTEINFGPMGSSIGNIRAGKMRALALSGPARSKLLPEIPTLTEVGVNMPEESSWYGFFAPKGTPKAVIAKVNADIEKVLAMPDMREREVQLGYRFVGGPPEKLGSFLGAEIAKWRALDQKGAFK
ncbi:MAG: tripartite tricarboxylate transporter substrate binding protein [Xanthobacteraceae bacterium]|nr:tripartite tricarboxylate transporter substrate binding protein [Xanthobacteraceae bacterium]